MIEFKQISKVYEESESTPIIKALSNINLLFDNSGLVFVLGKSGSGKSTLLNIAGGLEKISDGDIVFNGNSLKDFNNSEFDKFRSAYVGFIFQEFNLINDLSVKENINLALELQGEKSNDTRVSSLLKELDLEGYEDRTPTTLSGGEKQRVAIARCLIKNPEIILADEPTGSLDSENSEIVLTSLKKISNDKMVIVVSHDVESAKKYGDRIITLKDGCVSNDVILNNAVRNSCHSKETVNKKAKLPFLKCLKVGFNNIKHKLGKFIFSTLLTGFSLSFLGVCSTVLFFDETRCASDAALKNHLDSELFSKNLINRGKIIDYDYLNDNVLDSVEDITYIQDKISKQEIKDLNENTDYNLNYAGVYSNGDYSFEILFNDEFCNPFTTKEYSCSLFSGFCDCGELYLNDNSMPLLSGRYPNSYNEIAISKYHANLIINFYRSNEYSMNYSDLIDNKIRIDLKDYEYLDGKNIFKIVGIYDTGEISDFYEQEFKNKKVISENFYESYINYLKSSFNCIGFVSNDFYSIYNSIFTTDIDLKLTSKIGFTGIDVDYKNSIFSNVSENKSVDFLFSRFNNLANFSFYDLNDAKIEFIEPVNNQVYIDKNAYIYLEKREEYKKMFDSFELIMKAQSLNLLPEINTWLENSDNLTILENINSFFDSVTGIMYAENNNDYKNLVQILCSFVNLFYKVSFERVYTYDLIETLDKWNDIGNFGRAEFSVESVFFNNYIVPIRSGEFDNNVFGDCINFILNNISFRNYAENIWRYSLYIPGESNECDEYYNKINLMINSDNGKLIDSALWNNFGRIFSQEINNGNLNILGNGVYAAENVISISYNCEIPDFTFLRKYPNKIFYKNALGNKGTFDVIGVYETIEKAKNYNEVFANEEFINNVATAPDSFWYYENDLKANFSEDGIYDFVITKSSFSHKEVKEIMNSAEGYQYRFTNKEIMAADELFIILDQFYIITIFGCAIFGIFAALLLVNFISSSISYRKKEIGIIRCLGGRSLDIFKIFSTESMLASVVSTIVSCVLTIVACNVFNSILCNYFTFSILSFGFLNVAFVFVICAIFSLLATFIPILKISRMSPSAIVRHE